MKPLVKNLAAVVLLASTALLLVADSVEKCPFKAQDVTFAVSGNCGPEGTLRITTEKDRCTLNLEGEEAVSLPDYGSMGSPPYDLKLGGWSLVQDITVTGNTDGGPSEERATRRCTSVREDDVLKLRCEDVSQYAPEQVLATCEAVLTPQ